MNRHGISVILWNFINIWLSVMIIISATISYGDNLIRVTADYYYAD